MVATAAADKRAKMEEAEDDWLDDVLEKLQDIQDELEKIDDEENEKILELEKKCDIIRKPFYSRRNEIIRSIPNFWSTAFRNHPQLGMLLNERDEKIFKHITSLYVDDDDNSGYSIKLEFSPNPFFEDTELIKSYSVEDGVVGTTIKWKEGMVASNRDAQNKGKKRSNDKQSFFGWFDDSQLDISKGVFDEVGLCIKEELWQNPLKYFNNEVDEEFHISDDGGGDTDDGDEDEGADCDEDEDDD